MRDQLRLLHVVCGFICVLGVGGLLSPAFGQPTAHDHFMCYQVRESRGNICMAGAPNNAGGSCQSESDCGGDDATSWCVKNKFPEDVQANFDDTLNDRIFDIKRPKSLCAPANKNGEDPDAPTKPDHFKGYQVALARTDPKQDRIVGQKNVKVTNQFGSVFVDVKRLDRVLIPTAKSHDTPVDAPAAPNVDHMACYTVTAKKNICEVDPTVRCRTDADCASAGVGGRCSAGFPRGGIRVTVEDQFENRFYDVKRPTRLCRAATKTLPPNGVPEVPNNPEAELLCYQVAVSRVCTVGAAANEGGLCRNEADCGGIQRVTNFCKPRHAKESRLHCEQSVWAGTAGYS